MRPGGRPSRASGWGILFSIVNPLPQRVVLYLSELLSFIAELALFFCIDLFLVGRFFIIGQELLFDFFWPRSDCNLVSAH